MNLMSPTTKEAAATASARSNIITPLLLAIAAYPTWSVLTTSPLMLLAPVAIFAYWLLLRKKLYFVAGLLTALCVFKLDWLPFLIFPGLILGGMQYLGGVIVAATATFFGAQAMHQPLDAASLANLNQYALPTESMQNFAAFLTLILGKNTTNLLIGTWAIYVVAIVSSTELWWRIHHIADSDDKFLKKCAATSLIMLTASMHTTLQDYIVLVPIFVWLWQATADDTKETGGLVRKVITAYPVLTWAYFATTAFPMPAVPVYFIWAVVLSVTVLPTLDVETNRILNNRFKAQNQG